MSDVIHFSLEDRYEQQRNMRRLKEVEGVWFQSMKGRSKFLVP